MPFNPDHYDEIVVLSIFILLSLTEITAGYIKNSKRTKDDWWIELMSPLQLLTFVKPTIVFLTFFILSLLAPTLRDSYAHWSWWGSSLLIVLLVDDVSQYWYHRKAHEWEWLWKLHRPHHAATEMSVLVSYRNATLYYVFMPNIWWLGPAVYLGWAPAVAIGLIIKQIVIFAAHSPLRWDQYLYKNSYLHPLAWIIERTIATPATHFAHHGKTAKDGISAPNHNFGNLFFFWDILFKTAVITRTYPTEYGLVNDPKDSWKAQLYYPFIKSKKEGSAISSNYKKTRQTSKEAIKMDLEAGTYLWCACGFSKNAPFCDGSHQGTSYKPVRFTIEKKRPVSLCNCKKTACAPFCDNSH